MSNRPFCVCMGLAACLLASPAFGQVVVTDPATTLRNAATAAVKRLLTETEDAQHRRLRRMAMRLSRHTDLTKYAVPDTPRWRIHDFESDTFRYGRDYHAALNYGDARGAAYQRVARARDAAAAAVLAHLPSAARGEVRRLLATLDLADSTIISGTHQTGQLRYNGRRELRAIEALERHVIDPSEEQSATAVTDKISGAVLIAARQRQARIQLLAALLEQLVVDNKRARDAEVARLNMQLGQLRRARAADATLLAGAGDQLRAWRQP